MIVDRLRPLKPVLRGLGILQGAQLQAWPRDVVFLDLTKPLPYPDGSVSAVYSSHTLEHLYHSDAQALLRECRRVLDEAGVLRLALPDATVLATSLLTGAGADCRRALEFNMGLNAHPLVRPRGWQRVTRLLGSSHHRWQPTIGLVSHMLDAAGFDQVRVRRFQEGTLPDLTVLETRDESFFLEATLSEGPAETSIR